MDRLDQLTRALQSLPKRLEQAVENTVRDNAHVLEDLNTAQLAAGQDATGAAITPPYAPLTVAIKQLQGQPTDRVTLRDEGAFYAGIVAQLSGGAVELVGTDAKTEELQFKYGEEILGLSESSIADFREDYLRPELEAESRKALGI